MAGLSVAKAHPAGSPLVTVSVSNVSPTADPYSWDGETSQCCRKGKDNEREDFDIHDGVLTRPRGTSPHIW